MPKCQWHNNPSEAACGKEAAAKSFGAHVCAFHAEIALYLWGSEHTKYKRGKEPSQRKRDALAKKMREMELR